MRSFFYSSRFSLLNQEPLSFSFTFKGTMRVQIQLLFFEIDNGLLREQRVVLIASPLSLY